jgi:hypothetical protein
VGGAPGAAGTTQGRYQLAVPTLRRDDGAAA